LQPPSKDALKQSSPLVASPGFLMDRTARELTDMVFSESILEAAIGMACINSLIDIDESRCSELNASEIIAEKAGVKSRYYWSFSIYPKNKGDCAKPVGNRKKSTARRLS
jgi:hypothetical protein